MTLSLVLAFAFAWLHSADPLGLQPSPGPDSLQRGWRATFARQHLELIRSRRVALEEHLEWMEQFVKENPDILTPETVSFSRKELERFRIDLRYMREYERALVWWERERNVNPGPETDRQARDRINRVFKERDAWRRGDHNAPPPRERK